MKTKIGILLTAVLLMVGTNFVKAQKAAHVDAQALLESLPKVKAAKSKVQQESNRHKVQIDKMSKELQTLFASYQKAPSKEKAQQLQAKEQKLQQYQQTAAKQVSKLTNDLLTPIEKQVQSAIEQVAAQKGYLYVFNSSPGMGLIVAKGDNISALVKQKLGVR